MKDIPKHSFEDEFRKAFEEAEATPSPKLWAEIDAELANKEADIYKRKLYMYKLRVAAAAVVVFGFLGIWMLSSQFSGNSSLASLPQQTNSSQSNNRDGSTQADAPAENTPGQYPAVAQSTTTQPASNSPESTSRRSNGGNLTAGENGPQMQQNIGNSRIPATSPESIAALEVNKENVQQPNNRQAEEKGNAIGSPSNIAKRAGKKTRTAGEPALARTTPSTTGKMQVEDKNIRVEAESTIALLPEQKSKQLSDAIHSNTVATQADFAQTSPAAGKFSAYSFSYINRQLQPMENNIHLQAPSVKVKPNTDVYIEEEKEKEGAKSKSRWVVGASFAPGQFNPNMQVNPQATASLSNVRNNFSGRASSPLSNFQPAQNNVAVGSELENAESVNLSYNVGVNVGYALSEKFSLQSGLLYLYNNSQITTENYLQNVSNQEKYPEFMALIAPTTSSNNSLDFYNLSPANMSAGYAFQNLEMAVADKYTNAYPGVTEVVVYNTYQYMSIPLSLHYKLLDKKISTDIGAGVAADLFMKNTIGNPEENIANQAYDRGNKGPYKGMGFSGLFSARVKYKIASRYSVYVEPNYRTALTPFTNSLIVTSRPNSFGIGTGFQYRF